MKLCVLSVQEEDLRRTIASISEGYLNPIVSPQLLHSFGILFYNIFSISLVLNNFSTLLKPEVVLNGTLNGNVTEFNILDLSKPSSLLLSGRYKPKFYWSFTNI